jgi:hypothetical protein
MTLHVIDTNCAWIRSLVAGLPDEWSTCSYRIYSPQWLPNGSKDVLTSFRKQSINKSSDETLVAIPGWNKAPKLSTLVLRAVLSPRLRRTSASSAALFTFPFYSHVAGWIKAAFPCDRLAYHAHDPSEFYAYPPG